MNEKINGFSVGLFVSGMILLFCLWLSGGSFFLKQLLAVFYLFLPMAVSAMINRRYGEKEIVCGLRLSFNRYFLVSILLPFAIAAASVGIALLLPGIGYSHDYRGYIQRYVSGGSSGLAGRMAHLPLDPVLIVAIIALGAGLSFHALLALGGEAGWRGFLYREYRHRGFWRYSLWTGIAWGLWEIPLVLLGRFYPTRPVFGAIFVLVWCIAASPVFTFVRDRGRSIVATSIFLGLLNACQPLSVMVLSSSDDLLTGIRGLPGILILGAVNGIIFAVKRGKD